MTHKEFIKFAMDILSEEACLTPRMLGLKIVFPYDLRASLDMKCFDAGKKCRWAAFMNNAGTLCHVVSPEGGILVRLRFKYPVKHLSTLRMEDLIRVRLNNYIKF